MLLLIFSLSGARASLPGIVTIPDSAESGSTRSTKSGSPKINLQEDVRKLPVLLFIIVAFIPMAGFAGQIVLKNGDRLTGSIEKSDEKDAGDQDRVCR
jgi:hypothetical protein